MKKTALLILGLALLHPELERICRGLPALESSYREMWAEKGIDFDTGNRTSVRDILVLLRSARERCSQALKELPDQSPRPLPDL